MTVENLIPIATSIGGGFFVGIMLGYFVKKIIKIMMFVSGGVFGLLLYLQQEQIISVNIQKVESSLTFILNSVGSSFNGMTQTVGIASLGIPITASLTAGFTVGIMKG